MACGLPVITSSCAGISSLIQDGVDGYVLTDPKDVESLARRIRTLAENSEIRNRIGQNAAQTAQAWTWDRNAAAVWELLLKADAKKRQARR
jgi:glycosyltransferase involved in cell wall biosynthesis